MSLYPEPLSPAETIELEYMRDLLSDTPTGGESDVAGLQNAAALGHIRAAQEALKSRTNERVARGVEGTHTV